MSADQAAVDALHEAMGQVCAFADQLFEGTNVRFALVVWPEGFEAEAESMAIFAQPEAAEATPKALATASTARLGCGVLQ